MIICLLQKWTFSESLEKEQAFAINKLGEDKIIIRVIDKIETKRMMQRNKRILSFSETCSLITLKTLFWLCYRTNENTSRSWSFVEFLKTEKSKKTRDKRFWVPKLNFKVLDYIKYTEQQKSKIKLMNHPLFQELQMMSWRIYQVWNYKTFFKLIAN